MKELKEILRDQAQSPVGNKASLVQRNLDYLPPAATPQNNDPIECESGDDGLVAPLSVEMEITFGSHHQFNIDPQRHPDYGDSCCVRFATSVAKELLTAPDGVAFDVGNLEQRLLQCSRAHADGGECDGDKLEVAMPKMGLRASDNSWPEDSSRLAAVLDQPPRHVHVVIVTAALESRSLGLGPGATIRGPEAGLEAVQGAGVAGDTAKIRP